jgi:hypothetical protein
MGEPLPKLDIIELELAIAMSQLATPESICKMCDAVISSLKALVAESQVRGSDRVCQYFSRPFTTLPDVTQGGFSSLDTPREWYKGHYIGIGLNSRRESSLGFLTEKVIAELRRRFCEHKMRYYQPSSSSVQSLGSTIRINDEYFETPDGVFQISHTHSWYVHLKF